MRKIISPLLCVVLVIALFTACSAGNPSDNDRNKNELKTTAVSNIDTSSFRISYSKADSLDPYKTETLNNQVAEDLVYDSLFVLDEDYEAEPEIALAYSYPEPEKLSVTLKNDLKFSDGSTLDAENIVYSFEQAKESPHWATTLEDINSVEIENAYEVTFNLAQPNPNAHKLLTFAIARAKENDEGFKIGSGRYKFTNAEGGVVLEVNENHADFAPHFTKINLVNISSGESIENAINIGNISYAFRDLSDGSKTKITAATKNVTLNNLVYLGIYGKNGITADLDIRRAISLAIDRDTLVKSAYRGYAKSALSIYNPSTNLAKQTEIFSQKANLSAARQAISSTDYNADELKLTLVTDKKEGKAATAQLVKQQLESAGFKVNLIKDDTEGYHNRIQNGNFDIYIGETKLKGDLGLQSFFDTDGATHYGIDLEGENAAKSYKGYLEGENEIGKFIIDFSSELPFIPLVYRQGMICYTKSLRGDMQGFDGDYFSNIEDWYYN